MARPGITREQVFDAATALAQDGIQPTVKLVRDRIGGSFSTVTPHLAAWKEARTGTGDASVPDMPESAAAACRSLWAAAWKAGQEAIKAEREGLAVSRREMEEERGELAREIADLETRLDAVTAERDTFARRLADEEAALRKAKEEVSRLAVENARLEERVTNTQERADELRQQVARLEGDLARLAGTKAAEKEPRKRAPAASEKPPA